MWQNIFVNIMLLAAAALFGIWIGYWWLRSRYEDVTESYASLEGMQDKLVGGQTNLASREDMLGNFTKLQDTVTNIRVPDMTPVHERLIRVEQSLTNLNIPEANLDPLHERFTRLEARLMKPDENLAALIDRMSDMEGTIHSLSTDVTSLNNTDLRPVEVRLERLENAVNDISIPETDMTSIHTGIARLELALDGMDVSAPDLDPIRENMNSMETRLAGFAEGLDEARKSDLETVSIRLATLSSSVAGLRFPDMAPVQERLVRVENALNNIEVPATNFAPIEERLIRLENAVNNIDMPVTSFAPLEDRLIRLENAVNNIRMPDFDFGPIEDKLRMIETSARTPNDDVRLVHTKLSDIESGSASMQSRLIGLEQAINGIRADLHAMPDSAPIERRLANVHEAILAIREPDLTPLIGSLRKIDAGMDTGAMENRLTSIEYSLAAMHDMLRTRTSANDDYRPTRPARVTPTYEKREVYSPPPPAPQPKPKPKTRVQRGADPLSSVRRPNDRSNLLLEAAFGDPDDLEAINGVGPMLDELLNEIGVFYFWQIAEWTEADVEWVDEKLMHFKGRIERDQWVDQAADLKDMAGAARRPV